MQLAPGHHLYPVADGTWRHASPGDRFTRITGPDSVLRAFAQSTVPADSAAACSAAASVLSGPESEAFALLTARFAEREAIQAGTIQAGTIQAGRLDRPAPRRSDTGVLVEGSNPLADMVASLLSQVGALHTNSVDEGAIAQARLVISCADWLPDTRWRQLDRWCAEYGTAWHRCHVEGTRYFLGPLAVPGRGPGYSDLRGRRLAASGVAEELLAHWRYLDNPASVVPAIRWPGPGGLALLAGLLVHDCLRFLDTGTAPSGDAQLEVDPDAAGVRRHRVLPLPVTAAAP